MNHIGFRQEAQLLVLVTLRTTNSDDCNNMVWISAFTVDGIDDDGDGDVVADTASVDGDGNKCLPSTKIRFYDG